jgi:hypothetical protein
LDKDKHDGYGPDSGRGKVGDQVTFETLVSVAVFAIPVVVFITLLILLWRRRQRRGGPLREAAQRLPSAGRQDMAGGEATPSAGTGTIVVPDVRVTLRRIEVALANGDMAGLALLYLDLARGHERLGNEDARMAALRSAAGYGALHGPRAAHAEARLALAEAAYLAGDLTSACEQWQMARTAYLEAGLKDGYARVEKRMRDNGCPTDWVLTDF